MNANVGMTGQRSGGSSRSWWAQAFQNRLIALVLVMIVAVPLLAAPADYSLTGVAALTLESLSILLLTVLLWRARWDFRPEQVRTFLKTSANVPILLFLGWVTLSCVLSPYKIFSIQALLQAGAGALLYFAVAYQFRQSKHLSMLADVLLFLSLAIALGGLVQYQLIPQERAAAIFGDSQALGSFVTLMLPVIAALAFVDTKARRQTIAQVTFVLMVGALLLTQGRSAWIGSIVGLSVLAALYARTSQAQLGGAKGSSVPLKARKHLLVLPAVIAFIAVGFTALVSVQNRNVFSRVSTVTTLGTDASWQARVQNHWKGSVAMIEERPLLGWGAGLYPVYQHSFTGQGHVISPKGTVERVSIAEQAHNYYLQTAVELGLPGLVLTVAVLVGFWASAWKRLPQMDTGIRRTLLMASVAATAGFAIDALSSPAWQFAQTAMFVWLALGVGTSCVRPRLRREEREEEVAVAPVRSRAVGFVTRSAVLATSLCLATLLPTSYSAAQTFTYGAPQQPGVKDGNSSGDPTQPPPTSGTPAPNTGTGNSDGGDNNGRDIAIGIGAVTGIGYALYSLLGTSSGSAGTAGSGTLVPVADATPTPTPAAVAAP